VERDGHGTTDAAPVAPEERAREMLLMGLRLTEGIDEARFAARTGVTLPDATDPDTLARALDAGYLERGAGRLRATMEGRKRLDSLLAALVA
jgi:oxygen-independent coproporphyrinogen-3 oxidase